MLGLAPSSGTVKVPRLSAHLPGDSIHILALGLLLGSWITSTKVQKGPGRETVVLPSRIEPRSPWVGNGERMFYEEGQFEFPASRFLTNLSNHHSLYCAGLYGWLR